jgi:hypothetical protein
MNLIKELLSLKQEDVKQVTEGRRQGDMAELIEKYCDQEKMYHFEGGRGVNNFEKIIKILGYRDMDGFLEDNSGCLQAMIEWLGTQSNSEWTEAMEMELPEPEDEDKE